MMLNSLTKLPPEAIPLYYSVKFQGAFHLVGPRKAIPRSYPVNRILFDQATSHENISA